MVGLLFLTVAHRMKEPVYSDQSANRPDTSTITIDTIQHVFNQSLLSSTSFVSIIIAALKWSCIASLIGLLIEWEEEVDARLFLIWEEICKSAFHKQSVTCTFSHLNRTPVWLPVVPGSRTICKLNSLLKNRNAFPVTRLWRETLNANPLLIFRNEETWYKKGGDKETDNFTLLFLTVTRLLFGHIKPDFRSCSSWEYTISMGKSKGKSIQITYRKSKK